MTKKFEDEIFDLILKGKARPLPGEDEEDAAIRLLIAAAEKHSDILWSAMFEAFSYNIVGMAIPAMAAYLCSGSQSNENFKKFSPKIRSYILDILRTFTPVQLLDLSEYIKSKVFVGGMGSRNQKLLKSVLEKWTLKSLEENIAIYPKETYHLIKILHPKFEGEKSELVKLLTNKLV